MRGRGQGGSSLAGQALTMNKGNGRLVHLVSTLEPLCFGWVIIESLFLIEYLICTCVLHGKAIRPIRGEWKERQGKENFDTDGSKPSLYYGLYYGVNTYFSRDSKRSVWYFLLWILIMQAHNMQALSGSIVQATFNIS